MNVIVDTSVWSLALRRSRGADASVEGELRDLITDRRAELIGPIRQDLLSGIRDATQFERLRAYLGAFPDYPLEAADYEHAAAFYNSCRSSGVQGSNTDFLICAVAARHGLAIFTTDADFTRYAAHLPIQLHVPAPH